MTDSSRQPEKRAESAECLEGWAPLDNLHQC